MIPEAITIRQPATLVFCLQVPTVDAGQVRHSGVAASAGIGPACVHHAAAASCDASDRLIDQGCVRQLVLAKQTQNSSAADNR